MKQPLNKTDIRHTALSRRKDLDDKDQLSQLILKRLSELSHYASADNVLIYSSVRTEVRTWPLIERRLNNQLAVAIPYCVGNNLKLFQLQDPAELERGAFGILEPATALRNQPERQVLANEIDLAVVPGVAFDQTGNRLGYGKGYFDRLLADPSNRLITIGLAFDCQIVDTVPVDDHDVPMDFVITESRLIGQLD